jgi:hypothetical protein
LGNVPEAGSVTGPAIGHLAGLDGGGRFVGTDDAHTL